MNFATAFFLSIKENKCFRRKSHHFSIFFCEETGELQTGYNNEIYYPSLEDINAQDWTIE